MWGRARRRLQLQLHSLPQHLFRAYFFLPRITLLRRSIVLIAKTACSLAVFKTTSLDA